MDAKGADVAPERVDFSLGALFFIAWMFVGYLIGSNLFIGSIADNFTRARGESDGSALLTTEQEQWVAGGPSDTVLTTHQPWLA